VKRNLILSGSLVLAYAFPGVIRAWTPDLSKEPPYAEISAAAASGGLEGLKKTLGDTLAAAWEPSRPGHSGSCSAENFGKWVDLYQWVELLGSEESSVTKRWLARHIDVPEKKNPGDPIDVTVHQPGTPLVRRYDEVQHGIIERVARDPVTVSKVIDELVAQPFSQRNGPLIGRLDPGFVRETLSNPDFLRRFSASFGPGDFAPKVLLNLQAIWRSFPSDWKEFNALAVAVALVMDQPAPTIWPHMQVQQGDVPRAGSQPEEVFGEWVSAFRHGKLRRDPRQLEARELMFVVDAPLRPEEMRSYRDSGSLNRQLPPQAFASIAYDKGRVLKGVFLWPWGPYTLASIKEHGGICVDQAYYAAMAGKALGIPSMLFGGQGRDGGHAWVGFLKGSHDWDLGVGRYRDQNYSTGFSFDPQDWSPMSDHDLEMITRHLGGRGDPKDAARRELVMAWNFRRKGDAEGEGNAIRSALETCPENPAIWDAKEDYLMRTAAPFSELRAHHEAAIRRFSRFQDLRVHHQQALARLAMQKGDSGTAEHLNRQIVHENRGGRTDLSSAAAWEILDSKIKAGDPSGALEEFSRQLRLQGANGGGDFLYGVVTPFAKELIVKGRPDLARLVIKQSFDMMKPTKGSLVDRDLRKLWLEAGGKP